MVNLNGIDVNKKLSLSKNNNEIIYITCFKLSHSTLRRSGQMNGEVYWKNTGNSYIFVCPLHAAITDAEFIKQNIWNWSLSFPPEETCAERHCYWSQSRFHAVVLSVTSVH